MRGNRQPEGAPRTAAVAGLRTEVLDRVEQLERLAAAWDALAARCDRPAALAGWQLAWWRRFAAPGALLRAIAVWDGDQLVGLAALEARPGPRGRGVYRLLAADVTQRLEPLADPARRGEALTAIAAALAALRPSVGRLELDHVDAAAGWPRALAASWPGRRAPWVLAEPPLPAPFADLRCDGFDAWLARKSANFRQQARRFRRRLLRAGGTVRMAGDAEALARDVAAFARLHHARWDERGGSSLPRELAPVLRDAGAALLAAQRMRVWVVELDGRPVSVQIFLAAGRTLQYWNGGFDVAAAAARPSLVGMLAAIEDAIARGEETLDLGGGAYDYKLRIADGDRPLVSAALVPRGRGHLRERAALAPRALRLRARQAVAALPAAQQARMRRLAARVRR